MKKLLLIGLFNLVTVALGTDLYPYEVIITGSNLSVINSSSTQVQVRGTLLSITLYY